MRRREVSLLLRKRYFAFLILYGLFSTAAIVGILNKAYRARMKEKVHEDPFQKTSLLSASEKGAVAHEAIRQRHCQLSCTGARPLAGYAMSRDPTYVRVSKVFKQNYFSFLFSKVRNLSKHFCKSTSGDSL